MSVVDTATTTVTGTIAVGSFPIAVALSPDGDRAYVANLGSSSVSAIDTAAGTVVSTVATDAAPYALAVSPDGARVYLADGAAGAVSVYATATEAVTATVPVGSSPQGVAVTPDGSAVYATNLGSDTVTAIDSATDTVSGDVAVGRNPTGLAIAFLPAPAAPAPVVTALTPATGPVTGGTTVTIAGSHLAGATAVSFGDHPATDVSCSDGSCTATAPPGAAGAVDVTVTTPSGTSGTGAADRFTYTPVVTPPQTADLAVALTASPVPGLLGAHIDYTVTIVNHGPAPAAAATVTVDLPTPVRATSGDCTATAGKVTCGMGPLADGARTTRHFTLPVGLLSLNLPYAVTAARTASTPADPGPGNDRATRTCTVLTSLLISCS